VRYAQAVALILALAPHGARGQVVDQCQAAKIKAAGTKTFDEARCRAKALASGSAIHPGCLTRAEDRFVRAMAKADMLGSCSGTASDVGAAVDQCVDTYAAVMSVPVTTTTVTSLATTTTAVSTTSAISTTTVTTTSDTSTTTATLRAPCGPGPLCNSALVCDAGFGCATDEHSHCLCVPTPSCGESGYPTCGGNCPDGTVCAPQHIDVMVADFNICACVPPDYSCGNSDCSYGACPAGEVCNVRSQLGSNCVGGCSAP